MIVYRIAKRYEGEEEYHRERLAHVDMWHGPHIGPGTAHGWDWAKPTPQMDQPRHLRREIRPEEVCGCTSLAKLREWFGMAADGMNTEGFRLLTIYVPMKSALVLREQVLFKWADAHIISDAPARALKGELIAA